MMTWQSQATGHFSGRICNHSGTQTRIANKPEHPINGQIARTDLFTDFLQQEDLRNRSQRQSGYRQRGNSGIGQAIVLELARQGANVAIDYIANPDATLALEKQIATLGDQSIGVDADVSKIVDLQNLIDETVKAFGGSMSW
jgi:hypothetical protein